MRALFFIATLAALGMTACKPNNQAEATGTPHQQEDSTAKKADNDSKTAYACPMHSEVRGAKGTACPRCGMALTEPVDRK